MIDNTSSVRLSFNRLDLPNCARSVSTAPRTKAPFVLWLSVLFSSQLSSRPPAPGALLLLFFLSQR